MHLQTQYFDDDDGSVGRVRRARGISNNNRGIERGRGIYDVSEGSETTTDAAGARRRFQGIYDDVGGVSGGR